MFRAKGQISLKLNKYKYRFRKSWGLTFKIVADSIFYFIHKTQKYPRFLRNPRVSPTWFCTSHHKEGIYYQK